MASRSKKKNKHKNTTRASGSNFNQEIKIKGKNRLPHTILAFIILILFFIIWIAYDFYHEQSFKSSAVLFNVLILYPSFIFCYIAFTNKINDKLSLIKSKYLLVTITKLSAVITAASFIPNLITNFSISMNTSESSIRLFLTLSSCILIISTELLSYLCETKKD